MPSHAYRVDRQEDYQLFFFHRDEHTQKKRQTTPENVWPTKIGPGLEDRQGGVRKIACQVSFLLELPPKDSFHLGLCITPHQSLSIPSASLPLLIQVNLSGVLLRSIRGSRPRGHPHRALPVPGLIAHA